MWISYLDFNWETDESKIPYGEGVKVVSLHGEDSGNSVPGTSQGVQRLGEKGFFFFFFFLRLFIYLLAALGLCCCLQAFSNCGEQGLLFVALHGLLIAVASPVVEQEL